MAWCRSVQTPDDYLISSSDVTTCGHGNNYHTIIKLFSTTYNIILIAHGACGCAARVTRDTWRGDSKTRGVRAQTARLTRGWEYFGYFRNICSIFVAHKRQAETFMLFSPMWPRVWWGPGVAGEAGSGLMTIVNWPRHRIVTARTQMAQFAGISPDLQTSPRNTQKLYCKNIFIKVIMDIELVEHELPPALYVGEGKVISLFSHLLMNNIPQKIFRMAKTAFRLR